MQLYDNFYSDRQLWSGQWRPEDLTPDYIQSLSIQDALRLLKWIDYYYERRVRENNTSK